MTFNASEFIQRFINRIKELNLSSEDQVLIAWSGGMDSTLLVYLMMHYTQVKVYTAYYNHRLRPDAELHREINLLQSIAEGWKVPLIIGTAEEGRIEYLRQTHHGSLEEWARIERYHFLEDVKQKKHIDHLLTAHHKDDEAETLLIRFLQGASVMGLTGLEGKQPFRSSVLRPMLCFSREEIVYLIEELGLEWSVDSSNRQNDFLRNRIRSELIPVVEDIFPAFREGLQKGAKKNSFFSKEICKQVKNLPVKVRGNIVSIPLSAFEQAPSYLRLEALYSMADRTLKGQKHGKRIPYRFFSDLLEGSLAHSIKREGHGLILRIWKGNLQLLRQSTGTTMQKLTPLPLDKWLYYNEWKLKFNTEKLSSSAIPLQGKPEHWTLRNREAGDRMGKPGRLKKKLSVFPKEERDAIPLLVRGKDVLAIIKGKKEKILEDLKNSRGDASAELYLILEHNDAD